METTEFDSLRLFQECEIAVDAAICSATNTSNSYHTRMLRVQIALLVDHGGIFVHQSFKFQHPLQALLPHIGGLFGFLRMKQFP